MMANGRPAPAGACCSGLDAMSAAVLLSLAPVLSAAWWPRNIVDTKLPRAELLWREDSLTASEELLLARGLVRFADLAAPPAWVAGVLRAHMLPTKTTKFIRVRMVSAGSGKARRGCSTFIRQARDAGLAAALAWSELDAALWAEGGAGLSKRSAMTAFVSTAALESARSTDEWYSAAAEQAHQTAQTLLPSAGPAQKGWRVRDLLLPHRGAGAIQPLRSVERGCCPEEGWTALVARIPEISSIEQCQLAPVERAALLSAAKSVAGSPGAWVCSLTLLAQRGQVSALLEQARGHGLPTAPELDWQLLSKARIPGQWPRTPSHWGMPALWRPVVCALQYSTGAASDSDSEADVHLDEHTMVSPNVPRCTQRAWTAGSAHVPAGVARSALDEMAPAGDRALWLLNDSDRAMLQVLAPLPSQHRVPMPLPSLLPAQSGIASRAAGVATRAALHGNSEVLARLRQRATWRALERAVPGVAEAVRSMPEIRGVSHVLANLPPRVAMHPVMHQLAVASMDIPALAPDSQSLPGHDSYASSSGQSSPARMAQAVPRAPEPQQGKHSPMPGHTGALTAGVPQDSSTRMPGPSDTLVGLLAGNTQTLATLQARPLPAAVPAASIRGLPVPVEDHTLAAMLQHDSWASAPADSLPPIPAAQASPPAPSQPEQAPQPELSQHDLEQGMLPALAPEPAPVPAPAADSRAKSSPPAPARTFSGIAQRFQAKPASIQAAVSADGGASACSTVEWTRQKDAVLLVQLKAAKFSAQRVDLEELTANVCHGDTSTHSMAAVSERVAYWIRKIVGQFEV